MFVLVGKKQIFSGNVFACLFRTIPGDFHYGSRNIEQKTLAQGLHKYKSPVQLRPCSPEVHKTELLPSCQFPPKPAQSWLCKLAWSSHTFLPLILLSKVLGTQQSPMGPGSPSLHDDAILFPQLNSRILTFTKPRFSFFLVFKFGKDVKLHFLGFLASILVLQKRE